MALRNIVKKGDSILNKKCRPVTDFNERLKILLDDMQETLKNANGVGLAAPQVGIMRRAVIVLDGDEYVELINPEIVETEGEQDGLEGCLSVPDVWGMVKRPMKVKVRAYDRNGNMFEREGEGLTARAFCHEIDHLEGHLFTEIADQILTPEEVEEMMSGAADGEEE